MKIYYLRWIDFQDSPQRQTRFFHTAADRDYLAIAIGVMLKSVPNRKKDFRRVEKGESAEIEISSVESVLNAVNDVLKY